MVYLGRKRRRSLDYDDRRRSSIDRDETEMNKRGRSGQAGPDLHPEPTTRDRLISAYRYYETKWNITADQRFLTRKEFEDISNQIHSVDIARIVAAARNWNYFLPVNSPPPQARPAEATRPAAPVMESPPTPSTTPKAKTSAPPTNMPPAQPRAVRNEPYLFPPKPTSMAVAKPDAAIDDAVRLAIQRKADREDAFLQQAKKNFITEAVKLHEQIPKLSTIMTKSDSFDPALFGTATQPVAFDKDTVTAGLRLLTEYEKKVGIAYEKQMELVDYLRGYTFFGGIIRETEKVVKMYSGLRESTAEARGLLGDILLVAEDVSGGTAKA